MTAEIGRITSSGGPTETYQGVVMRDGKYLCPKWAGILLRKALP